MKKIFILPSKKDKEIISNYEILNIFEIKSTHKFCLYEDKKNIFTSPNLVKNSGNIEIITNRKKIYFIKLFKKKTEIGRVEISYKKRRR